MAGAFLPPGLGGIREKPRGILRAALADSANPLVVPGVVDALGARLVERAGFPACYLTGAGVANASLGLADVGLVSLAEMVDQAARVADATALPVIVDGDTGHGGPLSVMRTVHLLESAGAAAVQLEDQAMPKRCGHFDDKRLIDSEEMVAKLLAAARARRDDELLIIARTDARAVEGIDAAIGRARQYLRAGADVLFVEAPVSVGEMERVANTFPDTPLVANVVEGGRTPELPVAKLHAMGYRIVLHANLLLRAMLQAGEDVLRHLVERGETRQLHEAIVSWEHRQDLVHLDALDSLEDDLRAAAGGIVEQATASAASTATEKREPEKS